MHAFLESAFTKVGKETVRRYYMWQFEGPHELIALGAYSNGKLVGYLIGGRFRGALIGFLQKNWRFLILQIIIRPWLLQTKDLRERIVTGGKYFFSNRRKRVTNGGKERAISRKLVGILAIAIEPDYLRQGIGKKLVSEFEGLAIENDYHEIILSVKKENHSAIMFYKKLGWSINDTKDISYTMIKILQ